MTQESITAKKMIETFTYQISSTKSVSEIAANIGEACNQFKFSVLHTYDYFEILQTKGFPIERKVNIYEICQAKMASKMLTSNPEFSLFMPCKIVLYEDGGKTIISTMNMGIVLKAVEDDKELYKEATDMFTAIKELMNFLIK